MQKRALQQFGLPMLLTLLLEQQLKQIEISYMIPVDVVPRVSAGRLVIGI